VTTAHVCIGLLGALTCVTAADPAPSTAAPFRLIHTRNAETLGRDLQSAAGAGYRVLAASQGSTLDGKPLIVVLLQLASPTQGRYEYAVLASAGDLEDETTRREMNALGAQGYSLATGNLVARRIEDFWLPPAAYDAQLTLILERSTYSRRFTYDSIRFNEFEAFHERLAQRRGEGYEVLALVNSARRVRAVLGKPLDDAAGSPDVGPRRYRLLLNARNRGLAHALKRAGARGYRAIAAADPSINAPAMVLVERAAEAPGAYGYRVLTHPLRRHRRGRLQHKLNRITERGYRVAPGSSTNSALLLEREPQSRHGWVYRIAASGEAPGLPRALDDATREGYRFVKMLVDADVTIVLLERAVVLRR